MGFAMIVVDTNVLAALFLAAKPSRHAEAALLRDPDWAAPLLWRSELRNVLVTHMRRGLYELGHGLEVLESADEVLQDRQYEISDLAVLDLAQDSGCSAYDCEFVALATQLDVPLVTLDKEVLRKFPAHAVALPAFAAGNRS